MSRTLKIFLIVLGLGVFILPKQLVFAKSMTECSDHKTKDAECCKIKSADSCHGEKSQKHSDKENCGDDCTNCHSCTVHCTTNFISPGFDLLINQPIFAYQLNFDYGISYFSSSIQNIWQPPKIG